jgi:hypothetical protein
MTLSSSHYLILNVPYAHLLPEQRPQLDVSLLPEDDPKILAACYALSENLQQFDFGEFAHQVEANVLTILNGPTSGNPVALNHVSLEASQLELFRGCVGLIERMS